MSDQTDVQKTCELANSLPAPMAVDILTDALLQGDRKAQARIAELEKARDLGVIEGDVVAHMNVVSLHGELMAAKSRIEELERQHTLDVIDAVNAQSRIAELTKALRTVAETPAHHAGQTANEYHFQQIARAALEAKP